MSNSHYNLPLGVTTADIDAAATDRGSERPATGLLLDETAEQRAARHAWYDALAAGRRVVEEKMTINTPDELTTAWRATAHEIAEGNRKISSIRAGELAAARLVVQMDERINGIESACYLARTDIEGQVPADDIALYDRIFVDGWNYREQLINLSGTRTLILDIDDIRRASQPRADVPPFTIRAADAMAMVILDWVDRGVIDSRSAAADALLNYAGIRCDVAGDEINAFRKLMNSEEAPRGE